MKNVIKALVELTTEANKFVVENADYLKSHASNETENDYNKVFNKLISNLNQQNQKITAKNLIQIATNTQAKNTWFKRRAALKYVAHQTLINNLKEYQALDLSIKMSADQKVSQEKIDELNKLYHSIAFHFYLLKKLPQECPLTVTVKRISKRQTIAQLKHNWREMIVEEVSTKYQLPTLVSALTGCRPKELRTGIKVIKNNGMLIMTIQSAKVKRDGVITRKIKKESEDKQKITFEYEYVKFEAGQDYRVLQYNLSHGGFIEKLGQYFEENTEKIISIASEDNFYNALRIAGKKIGKSLWKRKPKYPNTNISAYCFRHQLAADMKKAGMSKDDISIALGQVSAATQSHYAHPSLGKSGAIPIKVTGAQQNIKPLHPKRINSKTYKDKSKNKLI